jgi:hypothetical protein
VVQVQLSVQAVPVPVFRLFVPQQQAVALEQQWLTEQQAPAIPVSESQLASERPLRLAGQLGSALELLAQLAVLWLQVVQLVVQEL